MTKRVSIGDIAKAIGLSKSTVSLALRDDKRIKPETRKKVANAAQELGYQADNIVSRLMSELKISQNREFRGTIGFIMLDQHNTEEEEANVKNHSFVRGFAQRAHQLGYQIDYFNIKDSTSQINTLKRTLYHRNIKGILFYGEPHNHPLALKILETIDQLPYLVNGFGIDGLNSNCIRTDYFDSCYKCVSKAVEYGYTKPALVYDMRNDMKTDFRYTGGYHAGLVSVGLHNPNSFDFRPDVEGNREAFITWLKKTKPDTLIAFDHQIKTILEEEGYQVAEDIGLIDIEKNDDVKPGWSGMHNGPLQAGELGADLLFSRIQMGGLRGLATASSMVNTSHWVDGETLPNKTKHKTASPKAKVRLDTRHFARRTAPEEALLSA